jgi:hypothetical protein
MHYHPGTEFADDPPIPAVFRGVEEIMTQTVSHFEETAAQLRPMRSSKSATAQARDQHKQWERIAVTIIDDGHIESAAEFVRFVDACLRYLAFDQVVSDRAYAIGVRNLADTIAQRWARGKSTKSTPTADDISGLLQSEWVSSGQFRSLRTGINFSGAQNVSC